MFDELLGLGRSTDQLEPRHMALRAAVVYVLLLAMVRLGGKRLVGHNSAFDLVLAIVLGGVAGRAIYSQHFFGPLCACATLVAMHWLTSWTAARVRRFHQFTDGSAATLFKDGTPLRDELLRNHIPIDELDMAAREEGLEDRDDAERIVLECNGRFSVLPRRSGDET